MECRVDGCTTRTKARGLCHKHYQRWRKTGDPLGGKTPKGAIPALVAALAAEEPDGLCRPTPYARDAKGYGVTKVNGRLVKITHLVLEATGRPRPPGLMALHSCDNPPCLAPWHLRWGTNSENQLDRWRGHDRVGGGET